MRGEIFVLTLAAGVLIAAAWLRGAEYDEQYTLFLTAGIARPDWPAGVFPAGEVAARQTPHLGLMRLAHDLRATDVHPPLYFWLVSLWRAAWGGGLFTARLLSVALALISLALTGGIARRIGVPAARAMLLTLGCYGFAYTGAIARGFALALCLLLAGLLLSLRRYRFAGGVLLGAATFTNYLAVFPAAVIALRSWRAALGLALFLPLDAWFFLAQRGSRDGQFPPFAWGDSLVRLARYGAASVFGGLPLYVPPVWRSAVMAAIAAFAVALLAVTAWRGRGRTWLAAVALSTPIGLLGLGVVFNTTPIELRYMVFALPLAALLVAGALPRALCAAMGVVQAVALTGLLLRPETMQPARIAATAAAALRTGSTVALIPFGNDGTGIPGAFGIEAPADLPLLVVRPGDSREAIRMRTAGFGQVLLVVMPQDSASRALIAAWVDDPVPGVVTIQP